MLILYGGEMTQDRKLVVRNARPILAAASPRYQESNLSTSKLRRLSCHITFVVWRSFGVAVRIDVG